MGISYSVDVDPDRTAKAIIRERHMSHKHSVEVARELRGRTAGEAVEYLEAVIAEERSVPFRRYKGNVGHRSDIDGWDAGRYPQKVSKAFLDLLENAIGNAEYQGFEGESMEIVHCAAHKVGEVPGRKPRAMGRASEWNTPEVDVELILQTEPEEETELDDVDEPVGDA